MKLLNIQLWLARSRRILIWLIGLLIIIVYVIPLVLSLIGYKVDASGGILGRKAAQENNVDMCNHIIVYRSIFGPPSAQRRADCVRVYAERRKDPSACELLMPSSYGLSCVGAAELHLPCDVTSIPYSVYWKDGDSEQTVHLKNCLQPNLRRSALGNQCCEVAKVAFLKNENDCSGVKDNTPIYDHCLYSLAWKERDPAYCSGIVNENAHAACDIQTRALQKDPSICTGCIPPIDLTEVQQLP